MINKRLSVLILYPVIFSLQLFAAADLTDFYHNKDYSTALQQLENSWSNREKSLEYHQLRCVFLSVLLQQTWESDQGTVAVLSTARELKKQSLETIRLYPSNSIGYTSWGEYLQYMPFVLGGNDKKAELNLKAAVKLNNGWYENYRLLLFYLNKKEDTIKAHHQITRMRELVAPSRFYSLELPTWLVYQDAVCHYMSGDAQVAEPLFREHLDRLPSSFWGWYFLWRIKADSGSHSRDLFNKALELGKQQNNLQFTARLIKESKEFDD